MEDTKAHENPNMPSEVKRMMQVREPEMQERGYIVTDEESSRAYEDHAEKRLKYYNAKYDFAI